ncbi:uncharacterized protein [Amphiura filiformis]|uniref:uncharacterized protein n=1 Tax=Amphiura filiformis TaxID=82378 RepID=UPI003B20E0A7
MNKIKQLKEDIKGLIGKDEIKYERAPIDDPDEIDEIEAQKSKTTGTTSVMWHNVTDFANIFKSFMGSGYLSNPFAYHQAGIGLGFIAMVFIAIATTHCCQLAVHCKKQIIKHLLKKQFPNGTQTTDPKTSAMLEHNMTETRKSLERSLTLQDIAQISLGVWGLRTVNLALFITQFGFCTSYIIFLGKTLQHLFGGIATEDESTEEGERSLSGTLQSVNMTSDMYDFLNSTDQTVTTIMYNTTIAVTTPPLMSTNHSVPSYTVFVLALYPIFVVYSLIRKMRNIGPISVVSNIINMSAYTAIMGYLIKHYRPRDDIVWSKWSSFPIFFGMMTGAYEGLGTIIPIESSMEGNREWYSVLLNSALFLYTVFMAGIGMLGYLVYGENVHQVIVWNLPHHIPLVRLLNISLLLNVLSTFPIQLFPAIETVEGLVFARNQTVTYEEIEMKDMGQSKNDMDMQIHQNGTDEASINKGSHKMPTSTKDIVDKAPTWQRNMVRVMIVTVMVVIALVFEHVFAFFGALVGSLGCSLISFILPCLMHLFIHGVKSLSKAVVVKDICLISVGICGAIIGIYTSASKIAKHMHGYS